MENKTVLYSRERTCMHDLCMYVVIASITAYNELTPTHKNVTSSLSYPTMHIAGFLGINTLCDPHVQLQHWKEILN